ncbi:MAG: 2-iminoacetate synthase ThiH [Verrucomicrobiota bacterium]
MMRKTELFSEAFSQLPLLELVERSHCTSQAEWDLAMQSGPASLERFAALISPESGRHLEELAGRARQWTLQRFGKVIRFFAPLYLSNECVNNCQYCGFSRDNPILRVTLNVDEVLREARALREAGFRHLLLVSGEHPKFASNRYMADCVAAIRSEIPSISLEVGPMEVDDYRACVEAGAESLVVYQETYDRTVYQQVHTSGPKKKFDWRLDTPERAYEAGFRRLGIGALFGLSDWRYEALAVAAHVMHLQKHCWKSQLTISLPRLRPHAGDFEPRTTLPNREMVQLISAFRVTFPDLGIVLSTREPAVLRDGLLPLGITHMSAGSHTEPGGYTGVGNDKLHVTRRGRVEGLSEEQEKEVASAEAGCTRATGQFDIADERSVEEVVAVVRSQGYEVVWKDWDPVLSEAG